MGYGGDNGPATNAQLNSPRDVEVDRFGNIFIADLDNSCIRKIDPLGIITTIAGIPGSPGFSGDSGMATDAQLGEPFSIAIDNAGNLYIATRANQRIRKVDPSGIITTIAGTGITTYNGDNIPATMANLNFPAGVAVDKYGFVYISETSGFRVRKIDTLGIITTIGGTGISGFSGDSFPATNALLNGPINICTDSNCNVYITDGGLRVRKIDINGIINTVAGNGIYGSSGDSGQATNAELNGCEGVKVDNVGNIYIADGTNLKIRLVSTSGFISTIAGNLITTALGDGGPATGAFLLDPTGIALDTAGNVFIADQGHQRIRKIYQHTVEITPIGYELSTTIFPNPSKGSFIITFSAMQKQVELVVTDMMGKEIVRTTRTATRQENITMDEPNGLYFLKITTLAGTETKQIIINH